MADIDIGWKVRLDDLQKQLQASTKLSNDEVRRMVTSLGSQFKKAESEATKAARAAEKEWSKSMDNLKGVAEKSLGMLGGPFAQLGEVVFDLGGKISGTSGAVGTLGVALGASAAAAGVLVGGTIALASAASEATIRLQEQGLAAEIPPEAMLSQKDYTDAINGLYTQVDVLTVQLGGPAMSAVANLSYAIVGLTNNLGAMIDPIVSAFSAIGAFNRMMYESKIATVATFGQNKLFIGSMLAVVDGLSSQADEGRQLVAQRQEEAAAAKQSTEAAKGEAAARAVAATATQRQTQASKAQAEQLKLEAEIAAAVAGDLQSYEQKKADMRVANYENEKAFEAQRMAEAEARHQKQLQFEADSKAAYEDAVEAAKSMALAQADAVAGSLGNFNDLATAVYDSVAEKGENATEAEKRAARTAFAISKALSVSQALISGATAAITMAASPAFASMGPFGPVLAAASAAAATAGALAQIASVKPPSFARGGMVDTDPDHQLIQARADEAVLTGRGVRTLGGPDAVEQLNRGMAGGAGGQTVVNMYVDGRRLASSSINEWGSLLSGRPLGRRPAYG